MKHSLINKKSIPERNKNSKRSQASFFEVRISHSKTLTCNMFCIQKVFECFDLCLERFERTAATSLSVNMYW